MIPMEGLTESSPNIILSPRLVNTTKGRIVVYSEAEHKEKAPDQYEEARIAYEARKNRKADPYPKLMRLSDGQQKLVKSQVEEDAILELQKAGMPVLANTQQVDTASAPAKVDSAASLMAEPKPNPIDEANASKTPYPGVNQAAPTQPAQATQRKAGRPKKAK